MRVAVVYAPSGGGESLSAMASSIVRALGAAGHTAEAARARSDGSIRLTGYDYIIVGTEPEGLLGRIPAELPRYLAQAGSVYGKRSMAFVRKAGLAPAKALARLMAAMEREGMIVNFAEILAGPEDAAAAARGAPVERA
jgi:hypothetical protein